MTRAEAKRLVRGVNAPLPIEENTVTVEGIPKQLKPEDLYYVGMYVIRFALEKKATRIFLKRGIYTRTWDVVDFLKHIERECGHLPAAQCPTHAPIATAGFRALGSDIDIKRPFVALPHSLRP